MPFKEGTRHWKPSEVEPQACWSKCRSVFVAQGPMSKVDMKQAKAGAYWDRFSGSCFQVAPSTVRGRFAREVGGPAQL